MNVGNLIEPSIIIAVITALVQAVKQIPAIESNTRWCPSISLFFGLMLGILAGIYFSGETEYPRMILQGIIYGLSASGLYSFTHQFWDRE